MAHSRVGLLAGRSVGPGFREGGESHEIRTSIITFIFGERNLFARDVVSRQFTFPSVVGGYLRFSTNLRFAVHTRLKHRDHDREKFSK